MSKSKKGNLTAAHQKQMLKVLTDRFNKNMHRHKDLEWSEIESKLKSNMDKLGTLSEMEGTGGEPDVIGLDKKQVSTFSVIALLKVLLAVEVCVMIGKAWNQGKNLNRRIVLLIWLMPWA
jgi:hypothetical protein